MWQTIFDYLGAERYSQHSICLTNDPLMIFLYVFGDLTTFLSYLTIGVCLFIARSTPMTIRPSMKFLYGSFILLCGMSHLSKVIVLFLGIYRLDVLITFAMASVSAVTATVTAYDYVATLD